MLQNRSLRSAWVKSNTSRYGGPSDESTEMSVQSPKLERDKAWEYEPPMLLNTAT